MKYLLKLLTIILIVFVVTACSDSSRENVSNDYNQGNRHFETVSEDKVDGSKKVVTLRHLDTGCYYLAFYSTLDAAGVGGIIPVLNEEGKPYCK